MSIAVEIVSGPRHPKPSRFRPGDLCELTVDRPSQRSPAELSDWVSRRVEYRPHRPESKGRPDRNLTALDPCAPKGSSG